MVEVRAVNINFETTSLKKEGTHLIKSLVVPMRVHELELRRHPIVLPHPQGVHDSELKLLITANVS